MKKLVLMALTLISFNAMATDEEPFKYPWAVVAGKLGTFVPRNADGVDLYQVRCNAPKGIQGRVIAKVRTNIVGDKKPYGQIGVQLLQDERASAIKSAVHPTSDPAFRTSKWAVLEKVNCDKNFLLAVSKRTFGETNPKWISSYRTTFACESSKGLVYPVSYRLVQNQ